ncbi:hypothetical protein [Flavobacterium sp. 3HN19-14]|uniref:hypothetical protein n=1 Tax=Flavobacterium sp. 3HN19-14 TaxID=3448133 RepID=UPI003EE15465
MTAIKGNIWAEKVQMKTMVSCTNMLDKLGFKTHFMAVPKGLKSLTTEYIYRPEDVRILNFYRFEGESNPDDSAILYAIETANGERGTLADAYGRESDEDVMHFIQQVEDIEKKVDKDKSL